MLTSHDYTTSSSPFLLIVIRVQMVSHLGLKDGTVLGHVEHGDLITHALIFRLRRKDPLSDGSHVVVGLCWGRKRALCSADKKRMWSVPIQSCSVERKRQTATVATTRVNSPWLKGAHDSHFWIESVIFLSAVWASAHAPNTGTGHKFAPLTSTFRNLMHTEEEDARTCTWPWPYTSEHGFLSSRPDFLVREIHSAVFDKQPQRQKKKGQCAKAAKIPVAEQELLTDMT